MRNLALFRKGDKIKFKDDQFNGVYRRGEVVTCLGSTLPGESQETTDLAASLFYPGVPGPFIYIDTCSLLLPAKWFRRA